MKRSRSTRTALTQEELDVKKALDRVEDDLRKEGITKESHGDEYIEILKARFAAVSFEQQLRLLNAQKADSKVAPAEEVARTPAERAEALADEVKKRNLQKSTLLPVYHPTKDFFVADIVDYKLKDDMATMEVPMFSLQTKPDMQPFVWQSSDGKRNVRIVPSEVGRATQFDKDLLIYVTSQLVARINQGGPVSKTVRYSVHDYFKTTNRKVDGEEYQRHKAALTRLSGTRIKTNILTGRKRITDDFALVDRVGTVEKDEQTGRSLSVEVTISDWLWNAIQEREVLTISPDYFRLRKALERRLYELARKHVGRQASWSIELSNLHEKTGSQASTKEFSRMLRDIIFDGNVPQYTFSVEGTVVTVTGLVALPHNEE